MRPIADFLTSNGAKALMEYTVLAFLVLYALVGLGEIAQRFPAALRRFREMWAQRRIGGLILHGLKVVVTLGPLYITFEVIGRLFPAVLTH